MGTHLIDSNVIIDYLAGKLPDAIIAATALVHGFELISRNTSDFNTITGLAVLDPHTL